jgi:hypothetical protein
LPQVIFELVETFSKSYFALPQNHRDNVSAVEAHLQNCPSTALRSAQDEKSQLSLREKTMNKTIQKHIEDLASTDDKIRMDALQATLKLTESKVDWVYEVWDLLLEKLEHENSYQRSIGIMLLCNLAKSDVQNRLADSLDHLLVHTKDEKFITSRQCIQNVWKIAAANKSNCEKVLSHLEKRFTQCADEKHSNLLRQDIIQSMLAVYKAEKDEKLLTRVRVLISKEQEPKYRKQYEALLKAK